MSKKIVTIKDVARLAGTSLGTVSNVINGSKTVKSENRERVIKAMEELEYIPNLTAQSLKTNKSKLIGLVLPTITNPFYPALAKGVEDMANRMGYTIILCNTDLDCEKEARYVEMLISNRAAGVILVKSSLPEESIEKYSKKIKITLIDSKPNFQGNIDLVETSNYEGLFKAVEYLGSLGHTRVAYITGNLRSKSDVERLNGYLQAVKNGKFLYREDYIKNGNFTIDGGYKLGSELLQMPEPPTAICCSNDLTAIGVIQAAKALNLRVPQDVSVAGFDDIDICKLVMPALTSIHQPKYDQGEKAARVLIEKINDENASIARNYILNTELKIRESTGICPK